MCTGCHYEDSEAQDQGRKVPVGDSAIFPLLMVALAVWFCEPPAVPWVVLAAALCVVLIPLVVDAVLDRLFP